MGPVRQNSTQRTVGTAHLSVLMTVHNFQYTIHHTTVLINMFPNMWQSLVEFRVVTSEDSVLKQERIQAEYNGLPYVRLGGHKNRHCVHPHHISLFSPRHFSDSSIPRIPSHTAPPLLVYPGYEWKRGARDRFYTDLSASAAAWRHRSILVVCVSVVDPG